MSMDNSLTSIAESQLTKVVAHYLDLLNTPGGYLTHVATMLGNALAENLKELDNIRNQMLSPKVRDVLNDLYRWILDPNIDGIVIKAESEKCSRSVTASEQLVLNASSPIAEGGGTQDYVIDNSVPHLREWHIDGYIMTTAPFAHGLLIHDDVKTKLMLLDSYAASRKPVLFKTHDCRFYKVIITSLEPEYDPKNEVGIKISVTLKEFKTMDVSAESVGNMPLQVASEVSV